MEQYNSGASVLLDYRIESWIKKEISEDVI
jgi:hypothetical protein